MKHHYVIFLVFLVFLTELSAQPSRRVEDGRVIVQIKPGAVNNFESRLRALNKSPSDSSILSVGIKSFDDINRRYRATNMQRVFPYCSEYEAKHRSYGLHLWYEIIVSDCEDPESVAASYGLDENVQISEPRYKIRKTGMSAEPLPVSEIPDDPEFFRQWNFDNTGQTGGTPGADIRLIEAWEKVKAAGIRNNNVIVAVIDDGVYHEHEDLNANMWVNEAEFNGITGVDDDNNGYVDDVYGYNFVSRTGTIAHDEHSTHIAGIISAVTGNGLGVSGISGSPDDGYSIKIMTVQILEGDRYVSNIAPSFIYAADNGAVIAQNSWGYEDAGYYQSTDVIAINYFINEAGKDKDGNPRPGTPMTGGIVIFAAGNEKSDDKWYPAFFDNVLAVAATNHYGKLAYYSNYGNWVDISAPGGDTSEARTNRTGGIYSTSYHANNKNFYDYLQGTSMSCPHVSGVAALILSVYGNECFTPDMLRSRLLHSATPLTTFDPVNASKMGAGLVNASAALTPFSAPTTVNDLTAEMLNAVSCQLNWTVPEDSDELGYYSIACATEMITEDNFDQYLHEQIFILQTTGTNIQTIVTGLNPGTKYYISIRSSGYECHISTISNVATVTMRDNNPPVLSQPLPEPFPDLTLRNVAGETEFYIANMFTDSDDDELTYKISVGSIRVATAKTMGDYLLITPVAAGTTTLILSADDGNGGIANCSISLTVTQNLAPKFKNLITDTTLIPFSKPTMIDLSGYASDPEGDPIFFHVQEPTDKNILIANVNGNMLSIAPQGHGYVVLKITASDPYSASASEIIHVTVEQKYATEKPDQLLAYPNPANDMLWYSFVLTDKTASISIRIVDSAGKAILQLPVEDLSEGTYYYNINLQGWGAGMYFLQYIKNGKVVDVKGVVKL